MNKLKKTVLIGISFFSLAFCFSCFATVSSENNDFLTQVFQPSLAGESGAGTIIGGGSMGTDKDKVGETLLKERTEIDLFKYDEEEEKGKRWVKNETSSILVIVTKLLLRITILLSITIIIYNGIMYVVKSSKGENPQDVLKNLIYIGAGILVALFSVIIVRIIGSVGTTSLRIF